MSRDGQIERYNCDVGVVLYKRVERGRESGVDSWDGFT